LLRGALENNQLVLHYQPLVDFKSGRIVGAEALLRWDHPDLGRVPPLEFIPVAEETGLIVPIGSWVLHSACSQLKRWIDEGLPPIRMAVNVALCQLQKGDFAPIVRDVLDDVGLDPRRLELELSERGVLRSDPEIVHQMNEIKAMGVRLSVDDFGTGQSAIAYLRGFELDVLKIDRSYVKNLERNEDDVAITSAIVAMAHRLRLAVIAEGVESEEQSRVLKEWGCDEFQGYLFSPALPAAEFRRLLIDSERKLSIDHDILEDGARSPNHGA
jgi:EAL domain-containing protein (putative c-di-GMP-specific phosphodiesterase class I)